jgi:hypothetical protein
MNVSERPKFRASGHLKKIISGNAVLKAALLKAHERFATLTGVCGIGIGRRFHEKTGRYPKIPGRLSLCIKIVVERKLRKLKRNQRIPRWILVRSSQRSRAVRVEIDIVSILGRTGRPGRLSQGGRGWPTAGCIDVGRLFATQAVPPSTPLTALPIGDPDVGTVGALVKFNNSGTVYATTASHVFLKLAVGERNAPTDDRAVWVSKSLIDVVPNHSYEPGTVAVDGIIRDSLAFRVPSGFCPNSARWPDGFTGELADVNDVRRALGSPLPSGFIWVERSGMPRPVMIPIHLEGNLDPVQLPILWNGQSITLAFVQTWQSRFVMNSGTPANQQSTMGGDSGSGVFLWAQNNSNCRLLGFHFYEPDDLTMSYAADAQWFFREAFGNGLKTDYDFLL